jgi:hypothetical protein
MEFNSDRPTVVVVLTKLSIQFGVSAHLRLVATTKIMYLDTGGGWACLQIVVL